MDSQDLTLSSPGDGVQGVVDEVSTSSYSHKVSSPALDDPSNVPQAEEGVDKVADIPDIRSPRRSSLLKRIAPFWHDRLIEAGLILSLVLYYITGNANLGTGSFFHLNPLLSLPFLLTFVLLCWYRLSFAVALLPLALPYYLLPKTVVSHYAFNLAEIALAIFVVVAALHLLLKRKQWQYWLTWHELGDRLGLFIIPILVFLAAATVSIVIASQHQFALRAFRKEVFDPLVYLLLILLCLRSRQDLMRLLGALLATGLAVAFLSLAQYIFFRSGLAIEAGNVLRVHAAYGSANDVGLLLDYVLPIGLAMVVAKIPGITGILQPGRFRVFAIALCLPLLLVLYLSQSHGAWVAIAAAILFIAALSIRNSKVLIVSAFIFIVVAAVIFAAFHTRIINFLLESHVNVQGISTSSRRLYLWQSALNMIHDSPWFGYGMDNWLCHYSRNTICYIPSLKHYWILTNPVTHAPTGLLDEPDLSHPHNIFLQIWVSVGLFGLLAFIALLGLFFRLFARILTHLCSIENGSNLHLQWMTIGVGAAMFTALVQGQVDSSFLEQDLAFCFWTLVAALLLLRALSGTAWRGRVTQGHTQEVPEQDSRAIKRIQQ